MSEVAKVRTAITDEQRELADAAANFLRDQLAAGDAARGEPVVARSLWRALVEDLGVHAIAVPETVGGAGGTLRDLAVVLEAGGGLLQPAPLLSSAGYATVLLSHSGAEAMQLLRSVTKDGRAMIVVSDRRVQMVGGVLVGDALVTEGALADDFVVVVDHQLLHVQATDMGVYTSPEEGIDPSRPVSLVRFEVASPASIGSLSDEAARWARAVSGALAAAEIVGGMGQCLDDVIGYVSTREQFGRPIGSFQAVQHRCVDMLLDVERVATAASFALDCADGGSTGVLWAGPAALATALEAYGRVARASIQLHGATGFVWEHTAHRHLRRSAGMAGYIGSRAALLDTTYEAITA